VVTESVANVAGRAEPAGDHGGARRSAALHPAAGGDGEAWRRLAIALAAVSLAGFFSKESAVVLVGLMLLWT